MGAISDRIGRKPVLLLDRRGGLGGTAPYLHTWFGENLGRSWFNGYVIVVLLISVAAVTTLPETKGRDLSSVR